LQLCGKNKRIKADFISTVAAKEANEYFKSLLKGTIKQRLSYLFSVCGKFGSK
jgi:hypothetical protein